MKKCDRQASSYLFEIELMVLILNSVQMFNNKQKTKLVLTILKLKLGNY